MRDEAVVAGNRGDGVEIGFLPDRAAADIRRLLDADHALRSRVARRGLDRRAECLRRENSVFTRQRRDLETAERRMRAAFARVHMGGRMREDFIAGAAVHQRRGDVAHGSGRQEDRGFLAEHLRHPFAQRDGGEIVADLFVADIRARHRLAHALRGPRLGVRHQVDADRRQLRVGRGGGHSHGNSCAAFNLRLSRCIQKRPAGPMQVARIGCLH